MSPLRAVSRGASQTLRAGVSCGAAALLAGVLVSCSFCIDLLLRMRAQDIEAHVTWGDMLAFLLKGANPPDPSTSRVSVLVAIAPPFGWLALFLVPTLLVLLVCRSRQSFLVALGSRGGYWGARCVAALCFVLMYWAVVAGSAAVMACLAGGTLDLGVSAWLPDTAGFARERLLPGPYDIKALTLEALLISAAMAVAHLAVSEVTGRLVSAMLFAASLGASVVAESPVLLGNYMMAARSSVFVGGSRAVQLGPASNMGFSPYWGVVLAGALLTVAVIAGGAVALRRDLLGGE